jgi:hypothetical protein
LPGGLVEEHDTKGRNRPVAVDAPAGLFEDRVFYVLSEDWVHLQVLDLAISLLLLFFCFLRGGCSERQRKGEKEARGGEREEEAPERGRRKEKG